MIDENKCLGCGACSSICPVGAIKVIKGKAKVDLTKCIKCGSCQQFCPVVAIDINKQEETNQTKKETK